MSNEKETKEFIENAGRRHEERLNASVDSRIGSTDELVEAIAKTGPRWSELAGVDEPSGSGAYRKRSAPVEARPEISPYCMPIKADTPTVEVAPGIMVSETLIRAAVEATSSGDTPQDHQDHYRQLKRRDKTLHEEVKKDLKASKKFVQEMFERANNPPNTKEKYVSFDAMSPSLQRVVKAYTAATEANKELDEAIKALAAEPRSSS